ncbi:hypothetical protein IMCC9480_1907 [Oxalobacteraceae bacterium IMCC9480]|nr:hypothetical protein IMCC9480_1907 [Oxalobacteraceae bacterium IMCC9480]
MLLVADHARLRHHVAIARVAHALGRVQLHDAGHLVINQVALGAVRQLLRGAVQLVVGRNLDAAIVVLAGVRAVVQLHEIVAIGIVGNPWRGAGLQLAGLFGFQQIRERTHIAAHADGDRVVGLFPHLGLLLAGAVVARRIPDRERFAAWQIAVAIAAFFVAELVEQGIGGDRVVLDRAFVGRVVADHTGWNRILQRDGFAIPDQPDFFLDVVGHGDGATQRNLGLLETAQYRVFHVPVVVARFGVDDARELIALFGEFGLELAAGQQLRCQRSLQFEQVDFIVLERQQARLVFDHHGDLDATDLRHALALEAGDDGLVFGIAACLEVPGKAAIGRTGGQFDARRTDPFGQVIRAGANRIGHDLAAGVVVFLDHFARDGTGGHVCQDHAEVEVGLGQADTQGVRIDEFETGDRRVVVKLAGLFGFLGELVETDDLALEQPGMR